jgi:hypothetical protein
VVPAKGIKDLKVSINQDYLIDEWYKGRYAYYAKLKKQVHYKTDTNDGFSYHLYVSCGQK